MSLRLRKGIALLIAVTLLTAGLLAVPSFAVYAAPDDGGRVPYYYCFDKLHTTGCSDTRISVLRNLRLDLGQPLEAVGWLATDEGVTAYQYMWVPTGGGTGKWETVTDLRITPRPDLVSAEIPYVSGHNSAGFHFSVPPPADLAEGYYDIYIRALDGMGTPCDLAAILNLRYGQPDEITESCRRISFPRVRREGNAALFGGASVEDNAIVLPPDGGVRLGTLNLAGFEGVKLTYEVTDPNATGKTPVLGLKSAGEYSYGKGSEGYNVTHSLVYTPISTDTTEVLLDLTSCDEMCEVWLTGHLNSEIRITNIEFVSNGYGTDRVAARIQLSADLMNGYFVSPNRTELKGITDPVLGDVLRMEVKEETNDPYVHFHAGALLKDHGIVLDANEYKYMVILYRADPANNTNRMSLYLCSGSITGATEECNHGVNLIPDGKWRYLLVDLTQRANWGGIINGWRFDYISGNSDVGDGVDFASVQFFRTAEAATAAAARDPAKAQAFTLGDTPVIRDMSEEQGQNDLNGTPTIDPADTFEVTEAPTEPPSEPVPDPDTPPDADTDSTPEDSTDTSPDGTSHGGKGCRSALFLPVILPALILPTPVLYKRKNKTQQR